MITFQTTNEEEFAAHINGYSTQIHESVRMGMQRIGIMLQRYIVSEKLSGQALNRRSGKLANSVNQQVVESGNAIVAKVTAGSVAPYAQIHEYGGVFQVPEHMSMSRLGKAYSVSAHSATYPARSFMRSSLAANQAQFVKMIENAVQEAMKP